MRAVIGFGFGLAMLAAPAFAQTKPKPPVQPVQTTEIRMPADMPGADAQMALAKRYVAEGKVPGIVIQVGHADAYNTITTANHGRVADAPTAHRADDESLWRVYSMTKPITGIAAMILIEEGKLGLDQPISDFIPAFKNMKVLVDPSKDLTSRPATKPITVRNLLTHTAGLGYNIITKGPLLDEYNKLGINPAQVNAQMEVQMAAARPGSLEEFANRTASLPLIAEPGAKWSYSIGLDILGRVIEVAGGMPFDQFVNTRIFKPLKMEQSYWTVPADKVGNFATNYVFMGSTRVPADPAVGSVYLQKPEFPYGGAGLVMSAHDYGRFLRMLRNKGWLDGVRLLKPETVVLAMSNLLPAGTDTSLLNDMTSDTGAPLGFGAGGSVYLADVPGGPGKGTFGWGGAAGTIAWVDPVHKIDVVAMINLFGDTELKRAVSKAVYADLAKVIRTK
ncbi:CubicO group peptidase (beta-lactamase class C family) [Sphingomonas kyeonggiensis]|uniref:CubicO group peptidase (Beta-lactamase class C family) n=1 Tax=Sphingomonas kyeonggiensis TaxID=1268553 RepID=A0A7W7JYC3_9SPHN|nr:serine hydrolase domain-containing protein [Sphingomonas kyeonggiensis]MBB4837614.1 CubicO group peptidase (beta-lactamase class C family) [Sphingomonas kyeonggiensis]